MHGGHTSRVNDLDWNPVEDLSIASVEEENLLHIFEIPESALK